MSTLSDQKIQNNQEALIVYLPDTRGVKISRYGKGNLKLGPNVITYSKLAEITCPGATVACRKFCYAKRIEGPLLDIYYQNTDAGADVPDLPLGIKIVRWHVSGDFDSIPYIQRWSAIVHAHPEVTFWGYTRSWRDPELLPHLEHLRHFTNVQLFGSVDEQTTLPPFGWRIAWIEGDSRLSIGYGLVCPEERGKVANCEKCGFCFKPVKSPVHHTDVVFLKH